MKKNILVVSLLILSICSQAQVKTRRLPSIINHPTFNLYAPYISLDGNALLFVSNDGEDGALTVSYTSRETDWVEPVNLPKNVNHRLIYLRGFSLNADGKRMYFTSTKSPVIGGYDIMSSEQKGTTWTEPQNLGAPINSKTNEGCPSFTPDGMTLYFMRCDKMDQSVASGCKIFSVKKKTNGQWDEPAALPSSINTGNSQTPRIMADGETLIFSSDKIPGSKGGMDLYMTKLRNGTWTAPVPLDFVNTEKDDQFVSVAALGRYILKDAPGARKSNELVEYLIPDELRPRGVMKVEGYIKDPQNAVVPAYIAVTDLSTQKRVYSGRPQADGTFLFYLMEGTRYEMSVDPEKSNISFFAKELDLSTEKIPQKERVNVILRQPVAEDELPLAMVAFKPNTATLEPTADSELKRLLRVAKANTQLLFEIQITMSGYREDSLMSDVDLTEVRMDSIVQQLAKIDSAGQLSQRDTTFIRKTYHNDRTAAQAQSVLDYIVKLGGDPNSFSFKTTAMPAALPGEMKLTVKAVAKQR
ncbi:MAG TPA: hypothetical protein VK666_10900 [Chryseolinea sp.]|nr:hypothetical protein [Chryseolinea sp.]